MLAIFLSWTLLLPVGCFSPDSDENDDNAAGSGDERTTAMKLYDDALFKVQNEIFYGIGAVAAMDDALFADDETALDDAIYELEYSADELIFALAHLEDLENTIQSRDAGSDGRIVQPLVFIIGAGAVILGLYKFGKKMKSLSKKATEARNRRDEAAVDLMNNVPGSEAAYKEAKDDLQETGEEAVVEVTTKVTTEVVLAPVDGGGIVRIIAKELAGDAIQKGLKVLAATTECASNTAETCPIAVGETDAKGEIRVPKGKVAIVVSTPEKTRAVVEEVTVEPNEPTTVTVSLEPIADTPAKTPDNTDTGGQMYDTDNWDTDTGDPDTGTPGQASACANLRACCDHELFVDSPDFLAQCDQVIATNNDGHCQIMLNNLAYECR